MWYEECNENIAGLTNLASELTTRIALLTTVVLEDCLFPDPPAPSVEVPAFSSFPFFLCMISKEKVEWRQLDFVLSSRKLYALGVKYSRKLLQWSEKGAKESQWILAPVVLSCPKSCPQISLLTKVQDSAFNMTQYRLNIKYALCWSTSYVYQTSLFGLVSMIFQITRVFYQKSRYVPTLYICTVHGVQRVRITFHPTNNEAFNSNLKKASLSLFGIDIICWRCHNTSHDNAALHSTSELVARHY